MEIEKSDLLKPRSGFFFISNNLRKAVSEQPSNNRQFNAIFKLSEEQKEQEKKEAEEGQDAVENVDQDYWDKLLRHHYEQVNFHIKTYIFN